MKRLLILLLATGFCAFEASAQFGVVSKKITSNSMNVVKIPRDKTFYLAAGGQLNTATDSHFGFTPGYEAAIGYQWALKRNEKFGSQLGVEAGITSRGWTYKQIFEDHKSTGMAVFVSPINYVYRMGLGEKKSIWLEPHIGAFVAYDVVEDYVRGTGDRDGFRYTGYDLGNKGDVVTKTQHDAFDAGINLGIRLWVAKRISFDLSYRQGFIKEFAEETTHINYRDHSSSSSSSYYYHSSDMVHSGMSGNLCFRIGVKLNK